jgi:hypothetical protein
MPKIERRMEKMKANKILAILITTLLLVSAFSALFVNRAASSVTPVEPVPIDEDIKTAPLDTSEQLAPEGGQGAFYSASATYPGGYWDVGQQAIWTGYNGYYGSLFTAYYTLGYIGTTVEIWVQNNIKYPTGDPRNGPGNNPGPTKPTPAMLQYLGLQFENNILPKESEFFGAPLFHDGSNANLDDMLGLPSDYYTEPTGRTVILVCQIRDQNYYQSTYPYYIIGVHISAYEDYYYDRNVITVDAVSWFHNLGAAGTNWGNHYYYPDNIMHNHPIYSPYTYEATVAHEFQHLLHYELSPGDVTFMNEGCSMYSEFLCGYGIDPDYMNSYFFTPDNSLTEWGDQGDINILADYGAAALWTMYLADRYGPEYLRLYFLLGAYGVHGIEAMNYAWQFSHYNERYPEVYRDWKIANLIRADSPGAGKYNYKSLNLNDPAYIPVSLYEESGFPVPTKKGTDYGNTFTILGYDTGIATVYPWGSDYIKLRNWDRPGFVYFNGDESTVPEHSYWTMTADGWYSGTGVDLANYLLAGNAYVNPSDPTLTMVTAYGLETLWDYGFVQVSTDGGTTWTSLANAYTTTDYDPSAHPDIVANLPGLTDYNPDWDDWTTMTFDLTAYSGMNVMIGFRYMTDWATTYEGWWINSATVSGTALTLANMDISFKGSYQVNVLKAVLADGKYVYVPYDVPLDSLTNTGEHNTFAKAPTYVVLIVTPTMDKGNTDYEFKVYQK